MSKRLLLAALAVVLVLPTFAPANGLNLNGLGSRAVAMGGAFVGIANDFSAVFWNPAGAAGFRQPTFGFNAFDLIPSTTYSQRGTTLVVPEIDAKTQVSHYLGFLGAYYRPVGAKAVIGLGIGTTSGLGTMWDGADFAELSDGTVYEWSSKVGKITFSPLVAVKISEALSVGAAVNIDYGTFSLKMPAGTSSWPLVVELVDLGQYEENMNGWGFGATFGVLMKPVDTLSIGLTVRTPATVTFNGAASMSYMTFYDLPGSSDLKRKITWPLWIAGGVSFRPVARLLLSADVHWTQWSKLDQIQTTFMDSVWHSLAAAEGRDLRILGWQDTMQIRFGAEYILNATTALRAGYYHDPTPAPVDRLDVLFPSHTLNAFSIGVGRTIGNLQLDFGLEYLAGNTRSSEWGFMTIAFGMDIVVPSVSVSYTF